MDMLKEKRKAVWQIGNKRIMEGYAWYCGDDLWEFTNSERERRGKQPLLLTTNDLRFIVN